MLASVLGGSGVLFFFSYYFTCVPGYGSVHSILGSIKINDYRTVVET